MGRPAIGPRGSTPYAEPSKREPAFPAKALRARDRRPNLFRPGKARPTTISVGGASGQHGAQQGAHGIDVGDAVAGETGAEALARVLVELHAATGLPRSLREAGVEEDRLPELSREAAEQWTAGFNPRPVGEKEFLEIYRCAF